MSLLFDTALHHRTVNMIATEEQRVAQSPRFWDSAALVLRRAEFGL